MNHPSIPDDPVRLCELAGRNPMNPHVVKAAADAGCRVCVLTGGPKDGYRAWMPPGRPTPIWPEPSGAYHLWGENPTIGIKAWKHAVPQTHVRGDIYRWIPAKIQI